MKVTLLSYTPDALDLLLRTKGTRLAHTDDPATWSEARKQEHLNYMRDTIKSSWEFVDYTFKIEDVTRAFTHQLVRTRTGSYAQESQRTVDVSDHNVIMPEAIADDDHALLIWGNASEEVMGAYSDLLAIGMAPQDARGILPTNVSTSIVAKFNLRGLSDMAKLRLCTRTQGEYQNVFRMMREVVCEVHPWARDFLDVYCAAHATCAFPAYGAKSCPLYQYVVPQERVLDIRSQVRKASEVTRFAASPVAKDGKAQ